MAHASSDEVRCHDARNARLQVKQDRHESGRTLADEHGTVDVGQIGCGSDDQRGTKKREVDGRARNAFVCGKQRM
jgi:hypothetical protein